MGAVKSKNLYPAARASRVAAPSVQMKPTLWRSVVELVAIVKVGKGSEPALEVATKTQRFSN